MTDSIVSLTLDKILQVKLEFKSRGQPSFRTSPTYSRSPRAADPTRPLTKDKDASEGRFEMSFPPEKRAYPRYPVQKIASYDWQGRQLLTLTLNLGLGGMKINSHLHLPKDECLDFKLVLGADSIRPKGRVAYSAFLPNNQNISGIQFIEISAKDHMALQKCLVSLQGWPRPRGMVSLGARRVAERGGLEAAEE
jgi:hypothetical protein